MRYLAGVMVACAAFAAGGARAACDLETTEGPLNVVALLACVSDLQASVARLEQKLEEARAPAVIPSGAVVAFAAPRDCAALDGWSHFAEGAGRFILGAGAAGDPESIAPVNPFDPERPAALYPLNNDWEPYRGGERAVALEMEDMPRHSHSTESVQDVQGATPGAPGSRQRLLTHDSTHKDKSRWGGLQPMGGPSGAKTGQAAPHNNIPPYIALYLCRKD